MPNKEKKKTVYTRPNSALCTYMSGTSMHQYSTKNLLRPLKE